MYALIPRFAILKTGGSGFEAAGFDVIPDVVGLSSLCSLQRLCPLLGVISMRPASCSRSGGVICPRSSSVARLLDDGLDRSVVCRYCGDGSSACCAFVIREVSVLAHGSPVSCAVAFAEKSAFAHVSAVDCVAVVEVEPVRRI